MSTASQSTNGGLLDLVPSTNVRDVLQRVEQLGSLHKRCIRRLSKRNAKLEDVKTSMTILVSYQEGLMTWLYSPKFTHHRFTDLAKCKTENGGNGMRLLCRSVMEACADVASETVEVQKKLTPEIASEWRLAVNKLLETFLGGLLENLGKDVVDMETELAHVTRAISAEAVTLLLEIAQGELNDIRRLNIAMKYAVRLFIQYQRTDPSRHVQLHALSKHISTAIIDVLPSESTQIDAKHLRLTRFYLVHLHTLYNTFVRELTNDWKRQGHSSKVAFASCTVLIARFLFENPMSSNDRDTKAQTEQKAVEETFFNVIRLILTSRTTLEASNTSIFIKEFMEACHGLALQNNAAHGTPELYFYWAILRSLDMPLESETPNSSFTHVTLTSLLDYIPLFLDRISAIHDHAPEAMETTSSLLEDILHQHATLFAKSDHQTQTHFLSSCIQLTMASTSDFAARLTIELLWQCLDCMHEEDVIDILYMLMSILQTTDIHATVVWRLRALIAHCTPQLSQSYKVALCSRLRINVNPLGMDQVFHLWSRFPLEVLTVNDPRILQQLYLHIEAESMKMWQELGRLMAASNGSVDYNILQAMSLPVLALSNVRKTRAHFAIAHGDHNDAIDHLTFNTFRDSVELIAMLCEAEESPLDPISKVSQLLEALLSLCLYTSIDRIELLSVIHKLNGVSKHEISPISIAHLIIETVYDMDDAVRRDEQNYLIMNAVCLDFNELVQEAHDWACFFQICLLLSKKLQRTNGMERLQEIVPPALWDTVQLLNDNKLIAAHAEAAQNIKASDIAAYRREQKEAIDNSVILKSLAYLDQRQATSHAINQIANFLQDNPHLHETSLLKQLDMLHKTLGYVVAPSP
ncbi:hypothetical protein BZG36_03093 [Bifiguratus adelaidae]|uniref:Uncharacterized protein n=1 Tax=Bifiguratus adelaidae TaxID=1938954 RepID=A0A261XYX6_9FUNG|nr:hypothetical protein BZG36_03093 [Bifiguratus adelaidae]